MSATKQVTFSVRRIGVALVVLLLLGVGAGWYLEIPGIVSDRPPANSIMVISPYDYEGTWVFDDSRFGLVREPFVVGIPEMMDVLVADIPTAKDGFRLLFSAKPFPGYQKKLTWLRGGLDGNFYALDDPPLEGWICPAMFKYYQQAPKEIYVRAEPRA